MIRFWRRREEHRESLVRFLASRQPLALLADVAGNMGDSLIREGTRHLLADASLTYVEVQPDLHSGQQRPETLMVRGCGGYDQHFHKFMPDIVLRGSSLYRSVIILPSSFDPRQHEVSRCLRQQNVYAIARDMQSYELLAPFGRRHASMDCAIYHRRFATNAVSHATTEAARGMLLALRRDKGSPLHAHGLEPEASLNDDISLSSRTVDEWLDRIAHAGEIITDRLHVALAAALLGKRLVMVDPYDRKLSQYMAFVFGDELADRIELQDVKWLKSRGLAVPSNS
jgi:exopolysaccharide biosynthesis predicted pyruvyltransferase EpsI